MSKEKDLGYAVVTCNDNLPIPLGAKVKVIGRSKHYDVFYAEQLAETLTEFLTVEHNGNFYTKRRQSYFSY